MSIKSTVSKNIILRLSDLITGQSIGQKFDLLMKSQFWANGEITEFQNSRLKILIKHAIETVPYYTEMFKNYRLNVDDIQTVSDLEKIPILTKAIIKNEGLSRFTSTSIDKKKIIESSSSGSTGEPLFYLNTKEAYSMNIATNLRGWYWMGFRFGDKYIKLSQNPRKSKMKRIQDKLSNNLYLATNPLVDSNFETIQRKIESYKPTIIRCYPDPLLLLSRFRSKHPEFTYTPKAITTTGNTLYPEIRKEIEDTFNCKIFDSYSCEGNSTVFECPSHECYHSAEEYGISEVLDEKGSLISDGIGRLISTDLWNHAHPFIRYDTQDLVEVSSKKCSCGRELKRIDRIIGRDNDILLSNSGRIFIVHNFTGFFQTDHKNIKRSVHQFQILKRRDMTYRFRLVVDGNYDQEAENYIIKFWESELGSKVSIELCSEIPVFHNNKRKFIINE